MLKMFSVYDSKSEAYFKPFYCNTKGEAIRSFKTAANDSNTEICQYPADFHLFELGSFDESTGVITVLEAKINLGSALEHKGE